MTQAVLEQPDARGRRRVAARRCMVGLEEPVEIVEERPLDDGLPLAAEAGRGLGERPA